MNSTPTLVTVILCGLYILCPIDFIPELLAGPFGLIDDLVAGMFATSVAVIWNNRRKKGTEGEPPVLDLDGVPPVLQSNRIPPLLTNYIDGVKQPPVLLKD